MALSSFSHYSVVHMVANMYVLWTFSSSIVSLLGREQFLALYLSAGTKTIEMMSYTHYDVIHTYSYTSRVGCGG